MATNQYGLDTIYMRRKLELLVRDADNYKPDEMARALARLVVVADADVLQESEFSAAPRPVPSEETGWLIENGGAAQTLYRCINNDMGMSIEWTPDPDKALRFARKEDAQAFAYHDEDAVRIAEHMWCGDAPRPVPTSERLTVWFGSIPESNGKINWTAILHRGDLTEGFTLARSEYHDRVRYDADCVRHLLGELEIEPDILDYDGDLKRHAEVKP